MYGSGWYLKGEQKIPGVGAGKISRRLLGRSINEEAPPRVTIKEGHILEGHLGPLEARAVVLKHDSL